MRISPGTSRQVRWTVTGTPLCNFTSVVVFAYDSLPSEDGTPGRVLRDFAWKARPESGLDCLICAIFARQRLMEHGLFGWACKASPLCNFTSVVVFAYDSLHLNPEP